LEKLKNSSFRNRDQDTRIALNFYIRVGDVYNIMRQ
jgi:hypothetical protein